MLVDSTKTNVIPSPFNQKNSAAALDSVFSAWKRLVIEQFLQNVYGINEPDPTSGLRNIKKIPSLGHEILHYPS